MIILVAHFSNIIPQMLHAVQTRWSSISLKFSCTFTVTVGLLNHLHTDNLNGLGLGWWHDERYWHSFLFVDAFLAREYFTVLFEPAPCEHMQLKLYIN